MEQSEGMPQLMHGLLQQPVMHQAVVLRQAVKLNKGRALLEASGNINAQTIAEVAATGVNLISSGAITHSAKCLDIGLDFQPV